ncbi:HmuY protein [Filimonas lacunae]|uniref:HmuY protein n=1 Tax=Filimonas lacunae TaxID=477680 RepID=A0A173MGA0_9BACT|nr:HmuY family protein [Filimonas lacunae]BAV06510.1 hypothetical protein FLA_2529 [Filimonas lacunae]SIT27218.1 HmuY protein [Filimonas lacunae]
MRIATLTIGMAMIVCSCTKSNDNPGLEDGISIIVTDLPGDTTANMSEGGSNTFKTLYFNLATGKKADITDATKTSLNWDLAFTGPYNSEVYVNYGGYAYNPGYGGAGKGAVIQVDKPYNEVTTAPSDAEFDNATLTKIGWEVGSSGGWFFYSLDNHIAVPIKNRTFVLRTASGKYAKLELLNIYKGNPPVVTDLYWPAPYLTFRFFLQEDGSKNIKTN